MSRQFNKYMEDKFEYHDELRSLVCPASFPELIEALGVKNTFQAIDECISNWEERKEKQNVYI